ncbi:cyclin-dependent kinase inhibitor 1C-like isoform X2 [Camelus ferus]|uniref:Cyclin-dependent kinase inhibitor 1C-like isoform X2 n=1 Tax=Camelus ferus TaxID=419612 RepID=A0A8B8TZL5_CAMFR|nr:cyclin-dependent kinase inhibitor 1C-like isoform X2 [Camelus ferus]
MAEFLNEKQANIHAIEKMKSNHQWISEHKDEKRCETPFQDTNPDKTPDCETSAFYSTEEEDAPSPDTEEGVTEAEIEKDEPGTETDAGDEGGPKEPTDEKELTSVDGTDKPDMSGETSPCYSGEAEDAQSPDEEEVSTEPETEKEEDVTESLEEQNLSFVCIPG